MRLSRLSVDKPKDPYNEKIKGNSKIESIWPYEDDNAGDNRNNGANVPCLLDSHAL